MLVKSVLSVHTMRVVATRWLNVGRGMILVNFLGTSIFTDINSGPAAVFDVPLAPVCLPDMRIYRVAHMYGPLS